MSCARTRTRTRCGRPLADEAEGRAGSDLGAPLCPVSGTPGAHAGSSRRHRRYSRPGTAGCQGRSAGRTRPRIRRLSPAIGVPPATLIAGRARRVIGDPVIRAFEVAGAPSPAPSIQGTSRSVATDGSSAEQSPALQFRRRAAGRVVRTQGPMLAARDGVTAVAEPAPRKHGARRIGRGAADRTEVRATHAPGSGRQPRERRGRGCGCRLSGHRTDAARSSSSRRRLTAAPPAA